jgi:hypothetical protein
MRYARLRGGESPPPIISDFLDLLDCSFRIDIFGTLTSWSPTRWHLEIVVKPRNASFATASAGSAQQEAGQGRHTEEFYRESAEYAFGGARHGVPAASVLRLCTEPGSGWDPFRFIGRRLRVTPTTRISHPAMKDVKIWRDLPQKLHHRPIWPLELKPTATVHTDASMLVLRDATPRGARG